MKKAKKDIPWEDKQTRLTNCILVSTITLPLPTYDGFNFETVVFRDEGVWERIESWKYKTAERALSHHRELVQEYKKLTGAQVLHLRGER